jgi:hypothetical protein
MFEFILNSLKYNKFLRRSTRASDAGGSIPANTIYQYGCNLTGSAIASLITKVIS